MLEVRKTRDRCILCCEAKPAKEILINRDEGVHEKTNIVSFSLCDDCLDKLAKEFYELNQMRTR